MSVSRRWFLIGSAATIAAAHLPLAAAETSTIRSPDALIEEIPRRGRRIRDMMFIPNGEKHVPLHVEVSRLESDYPLLAFDVSSLGCLRWVAPHGEEIIVPETGGLGVSVSPDPGTSARFGMIWETLDPLVARRLTRSGKPDRRFSPLYQRNPMYSENITWRNGVAEVTMASMFAEAA